MAQSRNMKTADEEAASEGTVPTDFFPRRRSRNEPNAVYWRTLHI